MERTQKMKDGCQQCGTCCEKGGPTLHRQDRYLLEKGVLAMDDLITIRDGELVIQLESGRPEPTDREFIKIRGRNRDWCCRFLEQTERTCTIYQDRPLACRLLKCWDPGEVSELSGTNLLSRLDLIAEDDPVLPLVRLHQQRCPLPDMVEIKVQLSSSGGRDEKLSQLSRMVEEDLQVRAVAAARFNLPVDREMFYFGRPLFQLLAPLGVRLHESGEGIELRCDE